MPASIRIEELDCSVHAERHERAWFNSDQRKGKACRLTCPDCGQKALTADTVYGVQLRHGRGTAECKRKTQYVPVDAGDHQRLYALADRETQPRTVLLLDAAPEKQSLAGRVLDTEDPTGQGKLVRRGEPEPGKVPVHNTRLKTWLYNLKRNANWRPAARSLDIPGRGQDGFASDVQVENLLRHGSKITEADVPPGQPRYGREFVVWFEVTSDLNYSANGSHHRAYLMHKQDGIHHFTIIVDGSEVKKQVAALSGATSTSAIGRHVIAFGAVKPGSNAKYEMAPGETGWFIL